jgi:hypothetical protein
VDGRVVSSDVVRFTFPSRFVVEGVFWKSGVVRSFEMVGPVLFEFGFHFFCSRDL